MKNITWGIVKNAHYGLPREVVCELLREIYPLPLLYNHERRNCDEFAELLRYVLWRLFGWRGMGYLCDYNGHHCYNVALLVAQDGGPEFSLVEPQIGQFVLPGTVATKNIERYDLQKGWLML